MIANRQVIAAEKQFGAVKSPLVQKAYALWSSKRGARAMPSRADYDPIEMPELLPFMFLVDVKQPDGRQRMRLVGTKIVEMYGSDYTGLYLDMIDFGTVREKVLEEYGTAASEARPVFSDHPFRNKNDVQHHIERAIFPLSNDGESVNMLMAVLDFEEVRRPGVDG